MKRIMYVVMLLLALQLVSAGSITDLNYKDKVLFWDTNRQVDDYNVGVNADLLEGNSILDIKLDNQNYCDSNDASGWGRYQGIAYVNAMILNLSEEMNARMDRIEAIALGAEGNQIVYQAALIKSERVGVPVIVGVKVCDADTWSCTRLK